MTNEQLRHEFCRRVPDLYMDLLTIAMQMDRRGMIRVLKLIDLDEAEGKRGRLRRPPFTNE
jgi:hypothetical protein